MGEDTVVDEQTVQVLREGGRSVAGLSVAGRTVAGICSNSYVSGLSTADCVFSGRRAGRSVSQTPQPAEPSAPPDQEEHADAVR